MSKQPKQYRPVGTVWKEIPAPPKKENPWPAIFGIGFVVLLIMGACAG